MKTVLAFALNVALFLLGFLALMEAGFEGLPLFVIGIFVGMPVANWIATRITGVDIQRVFFT